MSTKYPESIYRLAAALCDLSLALHDKVHTGCDAERLIERTGVAIALAAGLRDELQDDIAQREAIGAIHKAAAH